MQSDQLKLMNTQPYLNYRGRIRFSNKRFEIDNYINGKRTSITFLNVESSNFVDFCLSSRYLFLLLDDNSIWGLKENDDYSFEIYGRWATNSGDQAQNYHRSELPNSDFLTIFDENCSLLKYSHFGLSIVDHDQFPQITSDKSKRSTLIACTDKYLFIAHSSSENDHSLINKLTKIDIELGDSSNIFTDFLSPGVSIKDMKCGYAYVFILDTLGCIRTFGIGTRGELGHGDAESIKKPKIVEALVGVRIKEMACGGWHNVVMTEFGDAYVWGWNSECQGGFDKEKMPTVVEPIHLEITDDISVKSVACGSRHTVLLLENGDVYGCGWNGYNQLGDQMDINILRKLQINCDQKERLIGIDAGGWSTVVYSSRMRVSL